VATIPSILQQLIDKASLVDPADGIVKPRHVVLVFHERSADIKYLQSSVKYNITDAMNVLDVVDTKEMHQYATQDLNGRALETVLKYLDIHYENLHNGGNDAVYTLRAMIGLVVDKRLKSIAKAEKARNEPME
jgi:DNA polymerase III alpha subunit (gram-positive type)